MGSFIDLRFLLLILILKHCIGWQRRIPGRFGKSRDNLEYEDYDGPGIQDYYDAAEEQFSDDYDYNEFPGAEGNGYTKVPSRPYTTFRTTSPKGNVNGVLANYKTNVRPSEQLRSSCPPLYQRYSTNHTFCQPINSKCRVLKSGIRESDIKTILNVHNELRNKIALGKERINNYPSAANMMQMEWDDELMRVSERHIAQCVFEHDCYECRQVENFPVGQNLFTLYSTRPSAPNKPNWKNAILSWYSEISLAPSSIVFGFSFNREYGHFTQIIWAETWKIGCSYLVFETPDDPFWELQELYFCNYGPGGNVLGLPIYDTGPTCSKCPSNTCCNQDCANWNIPVDYPGLCKSISPVGPQNDVPEGPDILLFCDFLRRDRHIDCKTVERGKPWETRYVYSGAYKSTVLRSGEKTEMAFVKTVKPKRGFCLRFKYRKGPNVAGQPSRNHFQIRTRFPERGDDVVTKVETDASIYMKYSLQGNWWSETEIVFEFSVPRSSPALQYLDIKDIFVQDVESSKC